MIPRRSVRDALAMVSEPRERMRVVLARPLEESLGLYLTLLLWSGVVAGAVAFLWALVRGAYLDIVRGVTIDYWRLVNYFGQVAFGTFFVYLFFGTFIVFLLSLLVHRFTRGARYVQAVAVTCMSTAPLLLFGWVNYRVMVPLLIWMAFLLVTGVLVLRERTVPVRAARTGKKSGRSRSQRKA